MLSDSESDGETLQQLTINEHFAKAYERKKEREELAKLKEKYGSAAESALGESDDDSEDTEEDEDGEELTPAVDAAILRTLARIKRKDPGIYDSKKDVFEEEQLKTKGSFSFNSKKEEKSKPLHMRQHILQSQLQSTSRSPSPELAEPTHVAEQAALRKETISIFHSAVPGGAADAEDEDDDDDILVPREKTKDEIEREEEEYRAFLAREVGEDIGGLVSIEQVEVLSAEDVKEKDGGGEKETKEESVKADRNKKKKGKERKSTEQEDHEFLMNYILNRGWIDKSTRRVPKYEEVTGSKGKKKGKAKDDSDDDEENGVGQVDIVGEAASGSESGDFDEEGFDEVAETFESSYNFRFEEPHSAEIATHPREVSSTVRREENPRKAARERKKQRKEEKVLQKREEVKRLKALKMKEIREKLERIGKEGGKSADDEALQQLDLEGDWDPEVHDRQMAGIYGDDEPEGDDGLDLEKPIWDDDIDITDIVLPEPEPQPEAGPSKKKRKDKKKTKDDLEEGGDVDIDETDADYPRLSNSNSKSKLSKKELNEAMDDVYGLEFNDLVGDLATRFRYTPVLPDTYGLSATEILLADDTELNTLVGLRKVAAPYRKDRGRAWDPKRKEKLKEFRRKLGEKRGVGFGSGGGGEDAGADGGGSGEIEGMKKKRKGKKERQKAKLASAIMTEEDPSAIPLNEVGDGEEARTEGSEPPAKKRKRRHKKSTSVGQS